MRSGTGHTICTNLLRCRHGGSHKVACVCHYCYYGLFGVCVCCLLYFVVVYCTVCDRALELYCRRTLAHTYGSMREFDSLLVIYRQSLCQCSLYMCWECRPWFTRALLSSEGQHYRPMARSCFTGMVSIGRCASFFFVIASSPIRLTRRRLNGTSVLRASQYFALQQTVVSVHQYAAVSIS